MATALSLQVDSSGRMWESESSVLLSSPSPPFPQLSSPPHLSGTWESPGRRHPTRQTWSEIKAGGDDKRQTFLPNNRLVMVGGGGDGRMGVSCAGGGGSGEVGIEDRRDLHVMQRGWLSHKRQLSGAVSLSLNLRPAANET